MPPRILSEVFVASVIVVLSCSAILGMDRSITEMPARSPIGGTDYRQDQDKAKAIRVAQWLRDRTATHVFGKRLGGGGNVALTEPQNDALERLKSNAGKRFDIRFRKPHGTPMMIKGDLYQKVARTVKLTPEGGIAEATAREFLGTYRALFRLTNPEVELQLIEKRKDELGLHHLRFSQVHGGLTVWPCELMVHLNQKGDVYYVDASYIPTPSNIPARAKITANEAKRRALHDMGNPGNVRVTVPELIVYGAVEAAKPCLAWKFDLTIAMHEARRYIIDATTGAVVEKTDEVRRAAATGSGTDGRGRTRTLNLWQDGNTYYMVDASKPMFDRASTPPNNARGAILIFDGANKEVTDAQFSAGLIKSNNPNGGWDPDAVGAAYGLSETFDYYRARFDRNSLDGKGGSIRAIVRYGQNVNNAFWFPSTKTMVFGFGNTREVDIAGHELTHGVMDSVGAGILEYRNQSGALNESMADIFGENVEFKTQGGPDWLKKDVLDGNLLLQNYQNPNTVNWTNNRPNPAKMSQFEELPLDVDNGGVHINSSITNHCYFQLTTGLPGAIGIEKGERIYYRAMTNHLQKQSQFIDMRFAALISAEEIFGADSSEVKKVSEAFDAVEIFDRPQTPRPAPIPTVEGPDSALFLRNDPDFGLIVLGRREDGFGDGDAGVTFNLETFLAPRRLSVSGDGSYGLFVTIDQDLGFIATDASEVEFGDIAGSIHAVAMAPDTSKVAVVLLDETIGFPTNQIIFVDTNTFEAEVVQLFAPTADGTPQDIIAYADSMTFSQDGKSLIYDALAIIPTNLGFNFAGWAIYSLDLATKKIDTILTLDEGEDFGNPSIGRKHPNLLTFEVIDKATQVANVVAADLLTGQFQLIATLQQAGVQGFPAYTGDDRAIIYTQVDPNAFTTVSLLRQELAEDGITPVGQPQLWLADADYAAIYRRGNFVGENTPPEVTITSPTPGQTFTASSSFDFAVNTTDPDGVAKVEFYIGSNLVFEDTEAPYSVSVDLGPNSSGPFRLTARAIDSVGAAGDSALVEIQVIPAGGGGDNQLPQVSVVLPSNGQTFTGKSIIEFRVDASDADGAIAQVEFFVAGNRVHQVTAPPYFVSIDIEPANAGPLQLTVRVTDNQGAANEATVTVNLVPGAGGGGGENQTPVFESVAQQTVAQGSPLSIQLKATDTNAGQALTYSLEPGAPAGASIDPSTGFLSWTPTSLQGPGTFVIIVKATDNGQPPKSATKNVIVTVEAGATQPNRSPAIISVPDRQVAQGALLAFQVQASDPDGATQTLTYSLEPGAPAGASIDSRSGRFTWKPSLLQGPGAFLIIVRVTDNGQPVMSTTARFTVTVLPASDLGLTARFLSGKVMQLAISGGQVDDIIRIEASNDARTWVPVANLFKTSPAALIFNDPESPALRHRYYRAGILP